MVRCAAACPSPRWHRVFLSLLPAILRHARYAFRHLHGEAREEAIQAVLCNACTAVARLAEGEKVERCDLCRRYESDAAALDKLRELGIASP